MQLISVTRTLTVPVEQGRSAITLEAGRRYAMHDVEVAGGRAAGVLGEALDLPAKPRAFDPQAPTGGRLALPFIGGLGDAISMLPVLASIRRQRPDLRIDAIATPGPAEVFALCPCVDKVRGYPLPEEEWRDYDHYLSMEAVARSGQAPGRPLPEVFAAAIGVRLTSPQIRLKLPRAVDAVGPPSSVPLVGVAVGERRVLRAYPQSKLRELVSLLVQQELGVVLLGHADPGLTIPVCPPVITDMRSRTPSVLELAVWLRAIDVVVCHDSFVMHLAGALGRPAVALFAPTDAAHAAPYANAVAIRSDAQCAPCHAAAGDCPLGHDRCVAWDAPAVRPQAVAAAVLERLGRQGRNVRGIAVAL